MRAPRRGNRAPSSPGARASAPSSARASRATAGWPPSPAASPAPSTHPPPASPSASRCALPDRADLLEVLGKGDDPSAGLTPVEVLVGGVVPVVGQGQAHEHDGHLQQL